MGRWFVLLVVALVGCEGRHGMSSSGVPHNHAKHSIGNHVDAYEPGTRVELKGLAKSHEMNGEVGVVKEFDPSSGLYTVQLDHDNDFYTVNPDKITTTSVQKKQGTASFNLVNPNTMSDPVQNPQFRPLEHVVLKDLKTKEYNGKEAELEYVSGSRWIVKLVDSEATFAVKPSNMERHISPQAPLPSSPSTKHISANVLNTATPANPDPPTHNDQGVRVGDLVTLKNLKDEKFNGKLAKVLKLNDKHGRVDVKVADQRSTYAVLNTNIEPYHGSLQLPEPEAYYRIQDQVMIVGLDTNTKYNGLHGKVSLTAPDYIQVDLENGERVSVFPQNLQLLAGPAAPDMSPKMTLAAVGSGAAESDTTSTSEQQVNTEHSDDTATHSDHTSALSDDTNTHPDDVTQDNAVVDNGVQDDEADKAVNMAVAEVDKKEHEHESGHEAEHESDHEEEHESDHEDKADVSLADIVEAVGEKLPGGDQEGDEQEDDESNEQGQVSKQKVKVKVNSKASKMKATKSNSMLHQASSAGATSGGESTMEEGREGASKQKVKVKVNASKKKISSKSTSMLHQASSAGVTSGGESSVEEGREGASKQKVKDQSQTRETKEAAEVETSDTAKTTEKATKETKLASTTDATSTVDESTTKDSKVATDTKEAKVTTDTKEAEEAKATTDTQEAEEAKATTDTQEAEEAKVTTDTKEITKDTKVKAKDTNVKAKDTKVKAKDTKPTAQDATDTKVGTSETETPVKSDPQVDELDKIQQEIEQLKKDNAVLEKQLVAGDQSKLHPQVLAQMGAYVAVGDKAAPATQGELAQGDTVKKAVDITKFSGSKGVLGLASGKSLAADSPSSETASEEMNAQDQPTSTSTTAVVGEDVGVSDEVKAKPEEATGGVTEDLKLSSVPTDTNQDAEQMKAVPEVANMANDNNNLIQVSSSDNEAPLPAGPVSDLSGRPLSFGHWFHKRGEEYDITDVEWKSLDEGAKGSYFAVTSENDIDVIGREAWANPQDFEGRPEYTTDSGITTTPVVTEAPALPLPPKQHSPPKHRPPPAAVQAVVVEEKHKAAPPPPSSRLTVLPNPGELPVPFTGTSSKTNRLQILANEAKPDTDPTHNMQTHQIAAGPFQSWVPLSLYQSYQNLPSFHGPSAWSVDDLLGRSTQPKLSLLSNEIRKLDREIPPHVHCENGKCEPVDATTIPGVDPHGGSRVQAAAESEAPQFHSRFLEDQLEVVDLLSSPEIDSPVYSLFMSDLSDDFVRPGDWFHKKMDGLSFDITRSEWQRLPQSEQHRWSAVDSDRDASLVHDEHTSPVQVIHTTVADVNNPSPQVLNKLFGLQSLMQDDAEVGVVSSLSGVALVPGHWYSKKEDSTVNISDQEWARLPDSEQEEWSLVGSAPAPAVDNSVAVSALTPMSETTQVPNHFVSDLSDAPLTLGDWYTSLNEDGHSRDITATEWSKLPESQKHHWHLVSDQAEVDAMVKSHEEQPSTAQVNTMVKSQEEQAMSTAELVKSTVAFQDQEAPSEFFSDMSHTPLVIGDWYHKSSTEATECVDLTGEEFKLLTPVEQAFFSPVTSEEDVKRMINTEQVMANRKADAAAAAAAAAALNTTSEQPATPAAPASPLVPTMLVLSDVSHTPLDIGHWYHKDHAGSTHSQDISDKEWRDLPESQKRGFTAVLAQNKAQFVYEHRQEEERLAREAAAAAASTIETTEAHPSHVFVSDVSGEPLSLGHWYRRPAHGDNPSRDLTETEWEQVDSHDQRTYFLVSSERKVDQIIKEEETALAAAEEFAKLPVFVSSISGKQLFVGHWYHKTAGTHAYSDITDFEYVQLDKTEKGAYQPVNARNKLLSIEVEESHYMSEHADEVIKGGLQPKIPLNAQPVPAPEPVRSDASNVVLELGDWYHNPKTGRNVNREEWSHFPASEQNGWNLITDLSQLAK